LKDLRPEGINSDEKRAMLGDSSDDENLRKILSRKVSMNE